ncbi:MAG: hypothetical protein M3Z75_21015 [Actinomycetota bacterium]|nr:hypothetical protein [Actinomycetota bacterium]
MTLSYALDVQQGFALTPGSRDAVGSLTAATIDGTTLSADLTVIDPVTNASMAAVGVLSQVQWDEAVQAPVSFTVYVSAHNHGVLEQILAQQAASTPVTLSFGVYEYAASVQKYFCAFTPEQPPLSGVISQAGGALFLHLAAAPTQVTKALTAYEVTLTAGPAAQVQLFTVASTAPGSVAMQWGL